ncbi:MAG: 3-oxoacid CoA-transferase subunit B [Curvibacter lanceolatus]|jgi:3-oxoadipate CoA-transferase beta subunit|uniref:3-oxoacid CoA-transferase subunit B n=1 Tax=Curvibacter lanceolatus TaxID=86182 RepID=UPI00035D9953|nr:3-oxoacid CoA-transferase subunit B [Curvibacter lanceolatus]MBV5293008.1 3-oxoacid CoA-transferase subunit B [Curvibacter lanceolatus]
MTPTYQPRSKDELARRVAADIHDGAYVNLGIGMPTRVANHIPPGREVILQSENGILGMGPAPAAGQEDYDLINAGKQPVTLLPGGAFFHHADSFAMMRGGHLDICVLGAFQVSATGDLANWSTGEPGAIPAVGGAMDLAIGAKQTWVMMDLLSKSGQSKVVAQCTYPLTGLACVKRIYTDLATLECSPQGLRLIDAVDGLGREALQELIGLPLLD